MLCCRAGGRCVTEDQDPSSSTQTEHVEGLATGESSGSDGASGGRRRRRQHGLASVAALAATSTKLSPADVLQPRRSSVPESTGMLRLLRVVRVADILWTLSGKVTLTTTRPRWQFGVSTKY